MDSQQNSDPVATLRHLENAVCESLVKWQCGTVDPYSTNLLEDEKGEIAAEVKRLGERLGFRYSRATLTGYKVYDKAQPEVVQRLVRFSAVMPEALRSSGGLLLYGPPGTGKDHLMAALLKIAVAKHRLRVEWFDGGELFDQFYFSIKSESASDLADLQASLRKPHVLAISDPQPPQGDLSDSQIRRLRDLIDARYRAGLSTWITTNLDRKPDAVHILTEPVLQRLKEGSAVICCDWPNHRERVKAEW